jgi:[ribosomal protein S18]-alanine N-acetyltransferase
VVDCSLQYNLFMSDQGPNSNLVIRKHRLVDLAALHHIDQICFENGIAFSRTEIFFHLNQRDNLTRVAELDGQIVGFAVGRIERPSWAHILTLDVIPEARRRRIGTALMDSLHEEFRRQKVQFVNLEVRTTNTAARKLYERFRYRCVETLYGYYRGEADAYRMIRAL